MATQQVASGEHDSAVDILDAGDGADWSLAGPESIEVGEVGEDYAIIKTTEVLFAGVPVTQYKIYYSNSSLETQDFDKISDVVVEVEETNTGVVSLKFENLDPAKMYYVVVTPVHPTDPNMEPLTMISNEVSFTTTAAAGAVDPNEKVFNQVGYTYNQDASSVALSWEATQGDQVEINLRHQSEGTYQTVGKAPVADGKFTFTVSQEGNYFLKLRALDAMGNPVGKEHIQTIRIAEVTQTTQPVQAAPQVGPTTDLIIGLMILAAVIYMVYRFRRIEE
ncbi:MAG: hypothetical protein H6765_04875 [Candidatus Peribacteria bacterium]|nr:MAG: hypothetical protein H6765_04875 [Candidatus Peribacteria bacterium]